MKTITSTKTFEILNQPIGKGLFHFKKWNSTRVLSLFWVIVFLSNAAAFSSSNMPLELLCSEPTAPTSIAIGADIQTSVPQLLTFATNVGTSSTATCNKPAGLAVGDLMIVGLTFEKGSQVAITATGWTLILRTNQSSNVGMASYYKIATASDVAASNFSFPLTNGPKWAIGISRIVDFDSSNPIAGVNGQLSGSSSSNVTAPSIAGIQEGALVMAYYTNKKNATFTPAVGTIEIYDHPNNSGGIPSNMLATFVQAVTGATGNKTAVASEGETWAAQQVAIRPGNQYIACYNSPTLLTATGGSEGSGASYEWGTGVVVGENIIPDENNSSIYVSVTSPTAFWVRRVGLAPCSNTTSGTVNTLLVLPGITYQTSSTQATLGFANGSATVNVTGGTGPFSYQWNDPFEQTTATTYGVFPGNYTCVVTDGNNCTTQIEVYVPLDLGFELTKVSSSFCNTSGYDLSDVISCDGVSGSQNYLWQLTPIGGSPLPEYSRGYANRNLRLSWISGIQLGETYEVRVKAQVNGVWGEYGEVCTIGTASSVQQTQLAIVSSPNNYISGLPYVMCNSILADYVYAAERYEWEFIGPNTVVAESPSYHIQLSSVPGLLMNTNYDVRVRARVDGQWGNFNVQRPIQIGNPANTQIIASQCGTTRALNLAIAAINTCGATSYTFRFQHPTESERIIVRTPYTCPLWIVQPPLTPGETYSVTVKVTQGGVEGDYSTACNITIAGPQAEGFADMMVSKIATEGNLGIYPNPNTGSEVRIELNGIEEGAHDVAVNIYDICGKLMARDLFGHQGAQLSRLVRFDQNLSTGLYLVHVTIDGENFYTEKMIVK